MAELIDIQDHLSVARDLVRLLCVASESLPSDLKNAFARGTTMASDVLTEVYDDLEEHRQACLKAEGAEH